MASLVAQPTAGALKSLETLDLDNNKITDTGCATLASALLGGKLQPLKKLTLHELKLEGNPAASLQG